MLFTDELFMEDIRASLLNAAKRLAHEGIYYVQ